jgi:RNA polymerase sigma-70 factor (ECF subfamily)
MDDQARFERLYREYADQVHAYARRRSDAVTADEVVADVFLVAWRRVDRVPGEALPWLLAVARRVLANQRRSTRRVAALRDRLGEAFAPPGLGADDQGVLSALGALGERDREVLLLIAWEGLSQAEVAEVLAIGRPAVATRLHRARRRLADALGAQRASGLGGMEVGR